jgi:hypothetical protein
MGVVIRSCCFGDIEDSSPLSSLQSLLHRCRFVFGVVLLLSSSTSVDGVVEDDRCSKYCRTVHPSIHSKTKQDDNVVAVLVSVLPLILVADGQWAIPKTFGQDTPAFKQRISDRASPLVRFLVNVASRVGWRYFFENRSLTMIHVGEGGCCCDDDEFDVDARWVES